MELEYIVRNRLMLRFIVLKLGLSVCILCPRKVWRL